MKRNYVVEMLASLTQKQSRHSTWKAQKRDKAWGNRPIEMAMPSAGYLEAILDREYELEVEGRIRVAIAMAKRGRV
jgi:hypothetical protein